MVVEVPSEDDVAVTDPVTGEVEVVEVLDGMVPVTDPVTGVIEVVAMDEVPCD